MVLPTRKNFNHGDVVVIIPPQRIPIDALQLALPPINTMPPVTIGFHPFRLVINLKFVDASQPAIEIVQFDPPIEIQVRYEKSDVDVTDAVRRPLSLGFWDGSRWLRFTGRKHNFRLQPDPPPGTGGWGICNVSNWVDPPHAWGT